MKMAKSRPNDENMSWLVTCQIINVPKPKLIDDENQLAYLTCTVNATGHFNNTVSQIITAFQLKPKLWRDQNKAQIRILTH